MSLKRKIIATNNAYLYTCTDIDECVDEAKAAECVQDNALCVNEPGTYRCQCQDGYEYGADGKCHGMIVLIISLIMEYLNHGKGQAII
jgi:hypothetical protein